MPIEVLQEGENLIFEDYANRKVTININDYLQLMRSEERRAIRPILETCLKEPTEVWWNLEEIEGKECSYYKYIKAYSNLIFIAIVQMDQSLSFELNNFYGYHEDEYELGEQERTGQLIRSSINTY